MRPGWMMAVLAALAGLASGLASGSAQASEVVLYDNANCQPPYRVLVASEPDLDRTEFGNEVASVQVVSGTWTFFRDDNYQSNNGPSFTLGPGGCLNMGTGAAAQFPPELMDSVQLIDAAPGPGSVIVLYDGTNLTGAYRVLTGNTPDLDAVEFDNRIDSFEVLAGAWRIFRDDNFQANNGPPVDANGVVTDIAAQLGFPADRASSVMRLNVASDPPPPPPPDVVSVDCPPGSATNGAACVDCASLGLLLTRDGGSCVCPADQLAVGSRLIDGVPVALCQPQQVVITPPEAPPSACSGNEVMVGTQQTGGGCLPCPENSTPNGARTNCQCTAGTMQVGYAYYDLPECAPCAYGSVYDAGTGRCVCPAGTQQVSTDGGGMPMCVVPQAPPVQQTAEVTIEAGDVFQAARDAAFGFRAGRIEPRYNVGGQTLYGYNCYHTTSTVTYDGVAQDVLIVEGIMIGVGGSLLLTPPSAGCVYRIFDGRLAEGWSFVGFGVYTGYCLDAEGQSNVAISKIDGADPAHMAHRVTIQVDAGDPSAGICQAHLRTVTLRGPAGADWRDAFR